MFTLQDGREQLYQWDINRRIIVNDPKINEVHFCNHISDCALVVKVKDGLADIPNILLQDARPIRVYAYMDDSYTLTEQQFTVKARTKPCDYVYTETEVIQYSALDERMKAIETGITDTVATEVNKYLEDNPITVDLSDYYNKAETNAAIDKAIEGIVFPETDLTGYATQQFVLDKVAEIQIPEEYITETELNAKGYATTGYVDSKVASIVIPDVSNKADKVHTHKLSDITDYTAPDLTLYATKEYVDDADKKNTHDIDNISFHITNIIEPTITGKADKNHKHTMSDITDYTAPDLSGYAKKTDIPDVSNFITEVPAEYVTDTELNAKGYLTEVPENYATKTYVTNTVQSAIDNIPAPDLSDYAKKTDIPDVSGFITSIPDEYITETELNNKGYITEHQSLDGKADKVHTHTMSDITDYVAPDLSEYAKKTDIPDVSGFITSIPAEYITESELASKQYATEGYVNDAVNNIVIPETDLSNYYTKTETDNLIDGVETNVNITDDGNGNVTLQRGQGNLPSDLSNYYTKQETDTAISTAIANLDIPDVTGFAKLEDIPTIPTNVSSFNNDAGYLTEHQSLDGYAKTTDIPDVSKYQTADQVTALINNALAGIATAEGGSY